ncbi:MAG: hypothetical protein PHY73_02050 [Candidatus Omnitrophica bacterium]|nr:hypothetical protein [Candidatus Omnitrophota bacterium]
MNAYELKAELRNKLTSLKTAIERLQQEKDVPQSFVDVCSKDLDAIEKLVNSINE